MYTMCSVTLYTSVNLGNHSVGNYGYCVRTLTRNLWIHSTDYWIDCNRWIRLLCYYNRTRVHCIQGNYKSNEIASRRTLINLTKRDNSIKQQQQQHVSYAVV